MYVVFPPEYSAMADAVFTQAQQSYQYSSKSKQNGLPEKVGLDELVVTIYDMASDKTNKDVAEYRWDILRAMSQGVVFVNFDNKSIDEAHFFNTDDSLPMEDQIESVLVAAKYAENRSNYYSDEAPKAFYAGPTYVAPLAVVVTSYDSKKEGFGVDYDSKMRYVIASLPEDTWTKVGFATARMSASLHKLLEVLPLSAVVVFDKKPAGKVESYEAIKLDAPKSIDTEFGIDFKYTVKRKEVREEE